MACSFVFCSPSLCTGVLFTSFAVHQKYQPFLESKATLQRTTADFEYVSAPVPLVVRSWMPAASLNIDTISRARSMCDTVRCC